MLPSKVETMVHYKGDIWKDGYRVFGPFVDENDNPVDDPCLYCRMQFRNKEDMELEYELNSNPGSGEGTITITDGTAYIFTIPEQVLPLDAGEYVWDFETYLTADMSDSPQTWLTGTMIVKQDVSYD